MKYLIDTNVLSELRKSKPSPEVLAWFGGVASNDLYVSVITLGEIEKGIEKRRAADPAHAEALTAWLQSILDGYADRIIGVDVSVARRWGVLCNTRPHAPADMMLAATAIERGLVLATRNVRDVEGTGARCVDPFARPFMVR